MAEKKTTKRSTKPAQKNAPQKNKKNAAESKPATPPSAMVRHQVLPCLVAVFALFLGVCCFFPHSVGTVGFAIHHLFFGLFGGVAFVIPFACVYIAVVWKKCVDTYSLGSKFAFAVIELILLSIMVHCFSPEELRTYNPAELWNGGIAVKGGGFFGGFIGTLMLAGFDVVGTMIIVIAALIIFSVFFFGIKPRTVWLWCAYKLKLRREAKRAALEEYEKNHPKTVYPEDPYIPAHKAEKQHNEKNIGKKKLRRFDPDVSLDEEDAEDIPESPIDDSVRIDEYVDEDGVIDEEAFAAAEKKRAEMIESGSDLSTDGSDPEFESESESTEEESDGHELDWKNIFTDPQKVAPDVADTVFAEILRPDEDEFSDEAQTELDVERERVGDVITPAEPEKAAPPPPPQYVFPPLELLREEEAPPAADEAELRANAKKLVDTLLSFNVKTKIVNVSKGPTITRYELQPEAGTRVRSIANLVDDIALNLASSGVRIEAPIPGKSAVGIEVPNKTTSMVCLRGLLDTPQFSAAPSKLTVALGRDVVGSPMYLDLAKMPHLLIAGATGSGKSVCINSIIVSLLYKARPDEVKLILIDPKKVELNVYNGLPHLLVPVVSDPKKAAGSLSWAVTEMERRFELIEEVGAREIKGYNSITAKDPEKEFLPQIVIVIDELADLMMTASDDVETYICRIAQKARAAGMHLIIGTQRPSVDVITGLIKANVPSRIAFTTSNQVDSRTIIDMAGAEKLIGRGDMLCSPIGASKPMRGQGSFVSDEEVEKITDFIKKTSGGPTSYSDEVIASIERAAELCGVKKGGLMASTIGGDDEGEGDPMLRAALELAVDSGKISTSLIQRKLSLGYGRAAKLIDRMEELGYVSAPEGQKPREVLITKEQFMEMVLKDADIQ